MSTPGRAAFAILGLALSAGPTMGEEIVGDVAAGHKLAREVCAECHHVEPDEPQILFTDVRTFTTIAEDPRTTALSLRVFLQTPHVEMPDLILSPEKTDNIIAYILSLRGGE
ncbi:cytochrome c [Rhodobacteraceae bacterium NNCM2]|nr:cytochrome c [Coraliihabitans acroporae]